MGSGADAILANLARAFRVEGELVAAERVESGHIHVTYSALYRRRGGEPGEGRFRLIHQRLNGHVFRDLESLGDNVLRVTAHLRRGLARRGVANLERRCLEPVLARDGRPLWRDSQGRAWRTFRGIEGARTVDSVASPAQAREVARAFGEFTALLDDLPPPPLAETIPDFHDLPRRFEQLGSALRVDRLARAAEVAADARAAKRGFGRVREALERGGARRLPRRVVHHDCKVNNVLLDERTGEGLCVIDLDTVMEGDLLSDFGELVRTATCPAPEDERDLSRIEVDLGLFEAVAGGYLAGVGGLIEPAERQLLPLAGPMFALMNAIRFLTDHLEGDTYYRVHREGHNLDRARAQLRLFERMMELQSRFAERLGCRDCGAGTG